MIWNEVNERMYGEKRGNKNAKPRLMSAYEDLEM